MKVKRMMLVLISLILIFAVLGFVGCKKEKEEAAAATEETETTEKEPPLGSEENPIIWSFVPSGEMERVASGAQEVADMLNDETGLYFDTNVATEYAGVIEALASDPPEAHMASLATFAYVMAADRGVAEAALVSVRYGSPTYNGQIIAGADTGISSLEDLEGKTFG